MLPQSTLFLHLLGLPCTLGLLFLSSKDDGWKEKLLEWTVNRKRSNHIKLNINDKPSLRVIGLIFNTLPHHPLFAQENQNGSIHHKEHVKILLSCIYCHHIHYLCSLNRLWLTFSNRLHPHELLYCWLAHHQPFKLLLSLWENKPFSPCCPHSLLLWSLLGVRHSH